MDLNVKVTLSTPDDLLSVLTEIRDAITSLSAALSGENQLSDASVVTQLDNAYEELKTIQSTQVLFQQPL